MKLPRCPACSAPPGAQCRNSLGGPHEARYAKLLRETAERLENRLAAPSLDGYGLAGGLRAAADLLDGLPGPAVHDDYRREAAWPEKVPLWSWVDEEGGRA